MRMVMVRRAQASAYRALSVRGKQQRWLAEGRRLHPLEVASCPQCGIVVEVPAQAAHSETRCPRVIVRGLRSL